MSFLDKAKDLADKAESLAKDHPDQAETGIDKAGDLLDKATGGRFSEQLDSVQDKARDALGKSGEPDGPAAPTDPGARP